MKTRAFAHLPRFALYDSSGALLVKCRMIGTFSSYWSFTDSRERELATIRFKWTRPILHLQDGSKTGLLLRQLKNIAWTQRQIDFGVVGARDFSPEITVHITGTEVPCFEKFPDNFQFVRHHQYG